MRRNNYLLALELEYPSPPFPMFKASVNGQGLPQQSGIYFVWDGSQKLAYIGQSKNLNQRVRIDKIEYRINTADEISYLLFPKEVLNFAESFYIGAFCPRRNFREYQTKLNDAENPVVLRDFKYRKKFGYRDFINIGIDI